MSSTVQVHYNDSPKEIMRRLACVSSDRAVSDRHDSGAAGGRRFQRQLLGARTSESNDVAEQPDQFPRSCRDAIRTSQLTSERRPDVTRTSAAPAYSEDIPKDPKNPNVGKTETVTGICRLTRNLRELEVVVVQQRFLTASA